MLVGGLSAVIAPFAALAQETASADWDLRRGEQATLAYLDFTDDLALAVRCRGRALDVVISGLPSDSGPHRILRIGWEGQPLRTQSWLNGADGVTAFSDRPAWLARAWRSGGRLAIESGPQDAPLRRSVVDLPRSDAAIDAVLDACGVPRTDPRRIHYLDWVVPDDAPRNMRWVSRPRMRYPQEAWARQASVTVSCLALGDRLVHCEVERETPADQGFGAEAIRASRGARVAFDPPEASSDGVWVIWRQRFRLR